MGDSDRAAKEKIFKQLDTLKDLQTHHVPELIKQIKTYESARAELTAAEARVNEAWEKVALTVGLDNEWGKSLKEISQKNNEILDIEKEWETIIEASFVQMINKGLSQETKNTIAKEKEVRKAITRMEQTTKNTSKSTLKRKKKEGDKVMDEYNQVLQEAERKSKLITADVTYQCQMTHFMILQSISKALKQKMEGYERIYGKSKELNEYLGACIKIQPDFANAPKASIMQDIYNEKKERKKGRSQTMSTSSLPDGNGMPNSLSSEGFGVSKKGPIPYSRIAEQKGAAPNPAIASATKHASIYFESTPRSAVSDGLDLSPPSAGHTAQPKARAKWAFTPQKEGDLPMKAGDVITILNSVGPWWMAENNGSVGRIPANYVELISEPPQLRLPPRLDLPAQGLNGPASISPRGRVSPRSAKSNPNVVAPFDLPPPIDLSPRGDPLPDTLPPPPELSPRPLPDILPSPVSLPPPVIDTLPLPDILPPPVIDTLPPPMFDDDLPPPAPVRDNFPPTTPQPTKTPVTPAREDPLPVPLPPQPASSEWQPFTTEQGYVYYYNAATGESKWTLD